MKKLLFISIFSLLINLGSVRAQAFAKPMHQYHCVSTTNSYSVLLTVNLNNIDEKIAIQQYVADVDRNYVGKTSGNFRFVYEESDEGITEAIIQAQVMNGAPLGKMAIQNRSDDFSRTNFNCRLIK